MCNSYAPKSAIKMRSNKKLVSWTHHITVQQQQQQQQQQEALQCIDSSLTSLAGVQILQRQPAGPVRHTLRRQVCGRPKVGGGRGGPDCARLQLRGQPACAKALENVRNLEPVQEQGDCSAIRKGSWLALTTFAPARPFTRGCLLLHLIH